MSADSDHFEVALRAGTNRVLVKVENGNGGWGFALSLLDADGQKQEDGAYGSQRLYSPGFLAQLLPQRVATHAPGFPDEELEWGIGHRWTPDSPRPADVRPPLPSASLR